MSIAEIIEKVKSKIGPFYNLILIIVIATIFFTLGRISALEDRKTPVRILYPNGGQTGAVVNITSPRTVLGEVSTDASGEVIGSKSGKKYYYPWCGTVKMIKPENQVKFASIEEAKNAGYTPGGNCKGLK